MLTARLCHLTVFSRCCNGHLQTPPIYHDSCLIPLTSETTHTSFLEEVTTTNIRNLRARDNDSVQVNQLAPPNPQEESSSTPKASPCRRSVELSDTRYSRKRTKATSNRTGTEPVRAKQQKPNAARLLESRPFANAS